MLSSQVRCKKNCIFYGSSPKIAEIILGQPNIELKAIACESHSVSNSVRDICYLRSITLIVVSHKSDLDSIDLSNIDVGISCGFGIIFPQHIIELHANGIINFHFGSLPDYRGRHPISFAMLNNEWMLGITAHLVDNEIDQGHLLAEATIPRSIDDTPALISAKIESLVLPSLVPAAVESLLTEAKLKPIGIGSYHKSLAGQFKGDLISTDYSARFLYNLIKSQSDYGGVKINGETWINCHCIGSLNNIEYSCFAKCKDGYIYY